MRGEQEKLMGGGRIRFPMKKGEGVDDARGVAGNGFLFWEEWIRH